MKHLLLTTTLAITLISPTLAQYYGGPPMWDRRRDPREEEYRWPRTHIGPQMVPCIYYGNCRGPRYEEDPEESWRRPRSRYPQPRYWED
jgi:hypothetical protein